MSGFEALTADGAVLARELSDRADLAISALFGSSTLKDNASWCVVAVGGYGRQELCPFSDLDLLFLLGRKIPGHEIERALEEVLYPLWDKGFNASHSVRTVRQALDDAGVDFFFRNSLIDARPVCGSRAVFDPLARGLRKSRRLSDGRAYVAELALHTAKRHARYGDAVYFLEPHLKEGHGGLRDCQSIFWALKVLEADPGALLPINERDLGEVREAGAFLLKTRIGLHRVTGRKTDRMFLEHQELLAAALGYPGGADCSPVEAFLKDYHTRALTIRTVIDSLLPFLHRPRGLSSLLTAKSRDSSFTVSGGLLDFTNLADASKDAVLIMQAFALLGDRGLKLSPVARSLVRGFVKEGGPQLGDPRARALLLKTLRSKHGEGALVALLETGALEALVPEFKALRGRTIFDLYHTFTVDLHSIHTVSELKKLEGTESDAFGRVGDRDALFFAAFLHDIGKGAGSPHAPLGADMAGAAAQAFGFGHARSVVVASLVRNHLVMADMATKRDLSDEKVTGDLAHRAGSPEMLSMLYLLTIADSRATGPNAWSEWKASLLRELYLRTLHLLEQGIMRDRKTATRLEEKWHKLVQESETEAGASLAGRFWALPQAYVHATELSDIRSHLALSARLKGSDDLVAKISKSRGHTRITVVTRDRPGLFALLTGILAINRMDVISADIFTWYDGTAVDTFRVNPPWADFRDWAAMERQFRELRGNAAGVKARIEKTKALRSETPPPARSTDAVTVGVDNASSDYFTLVEVKAHRRIGLVHDVSHALSALSLSIHRAFVSRSADLAACVYYVVDAHGEKITVPAAMEELAGMIREAALGRAIGASPQGEKAI